ncbi:MAG: hypothetical protein WD876_03175 [Candidatus Pacearchaeota archaeon]
MLEKKGYSIFYDWTNENPIKPYDKNPELTEKIAKRSLRASENCNLFILISDKEGTDMYGELCSAITSKKPEIYVIGNFLGRSKFFFHSSVKRRKTIEEVIKELK